MSVFAFIALAVAFPETKWHRDAPKPETVVVTTTPVEIKPEAMHSEPDRSDEGNTSTPLGRGRPSKTAFKIIMPADPEWKKFLFKDIIACGHIFVFPIVLWAGLCLAGPANLLLHWNITQSAVLSAPPNNFSVSAVGYSNFAFFAGGMIGLVSAGPFSDWYAKWRTTRNGNVREPEFRLPVLIPYIIISAIGIVIGGYAEEHQWNWAAIVVVGYGFTGLCVTSVPTIAIAYAVDSYRTMAGEIMVVATVIKNTCGFGMSYWVPSLTEQQGQFVPTMVQFGLVIGPMVFALPLYFWGKSLRRITKNSSVHRMKADI